MESPMAISMDLSFPSSTSLNTPLRPEAWYIQFCVLLLPMLQPLDFIYL